MVKACCKLGSAIGQPRLLCETPNFFVIPTLGSFGIEGYVLIVTKEHYLGFGMLPSGFRAELDQIVNDTKKLLLSEYGKPALVFEHGPRIGGLDSGKSIDHAHLHVVPGVDITSEWAVDMMGRLGCTGQFYRVERVEGFERAGELYDRGTSYLYVENLDGAKLLSEQNFHRPSQYFRKMVADKIGCRRWDWRQHPDRETLEKTVERLKGKF